MTANEEEYITSAEAALILDVAQSTVINIIHLRGGVKFHVDPKTHGYRFKREDIVKLAKTYEKTTDIESVVKLRSKINQGLQNTEDQWKKLRQRATIKMVMRRMAVARLKKSFPEAGGTYIALALMSKPVDYSKYEREQRKLEYIKNEDTDPKRDDEPSDFV